MLVITQETEQAFTKELEFCLQKDESWRCVILRFSKATQKSNDWFSRATEKIHSCLGDDAGSIFLFEDSDLYVLSRHATKRSFDFLITHLSTVLAPIPVKGLASLYELPMDWKVLKGLLAEKTDKKNKNAKSEFKRPSLLIEGHYKPLLSSIAVRREKREKPGILVVEDDPFSQRLVSKSLEDNFDIYAAVTGQEAVSAYIRHAPDMVFLDIGLPDASGLDVLLKIFEIDAQAHIVMLSGSGSRDNILKAVENGAKGFVGKPFTREKLLQYINKCPFVQAKQKITKASL